MKINNIKKNNQIILNVKFDKITIICSVAVVLIPFLMILLLFIYLVNSQHTVEYSVATESFQHKTRDLLSSGCTSTDCKVECESIAAEDVQDEIINSLYPLCSSIISLKLKKIYFLDGKIIKGWLAKVLTKVQLLQLLECSFDDIDENALVDPPFDQLVSLEIIDSNVRYIKKQFFNNMRTVNTLTIRFDKMQITTGFQIEEGALDGLKVMNSLTIQNCLSEPEHIINLTGTSDLTKLLTIDFRYNLISKLNAYSFVKATQLKQVFLSYNGLEELDPLAFASQTIEKIDISFNSLTYIHPDTFTYIILKPHQSEQIFAGENNWNCNCDLQWFQEFYLNPENHVSTTNPPKCNGQDFATYDFGCSATTSTSTSTFGQSSTTSVISTTPTPTPIPEYPTTIVKCVNKTGNYVVPDETSKEIIQTVRFSEHDVTFTFYDLDDVVKTELKISGDTKSYNLIWFNTFDTSETGCISLESSTVTLEELQRTNTYTLCLINVDEIAVSPYSCFGLKIDDAYENRTWIPNKYKTIVIIILIVVLLICIILSSLIMFCCVRQHPNMIKGNKRVVIVGKQNTDAIILPKNFDKNENSHSNNIPPGYITPIYDKIIRDVINKNAAANPEIHIVPPSRRGTECDDIDMHYDLENMPPPLPPFHPRDFKIYEDIYSTA